MLLSDIWEWVVWPVLVGVGAIVVCGLVAVLFVFLSGWIKEKVRFRFAPPVWLDRLFTYTIVLVFIWCIGMLVVME